MKKASVYTVYVQTTFCTLLTLMASVNTKDRCRPTSDIIKHFAAGNESLPGGLIG